jgi:hypothetical protein
LRGERWPLSRALGTAQFYAVRDQRTKSLGDALAGSSPAEEFGERGGCQRVARDHRQKGEHGPACLAPLGLSGFLVDDRGLSTGVGSLPAGEINADLAPCCSWFGASGT